MHTGDPLSRRPGPDPFANLAASVLAHFAENKPEPESFPAIAAQVIDVAEHPDVDARKLAHLIERDAGMSAAVLRMANSALYRRAEPVATLRNAIALLGLRRVANIAVGLACHALFDVEARVQHELYPARWDRLFHSAMTEAFAATYVATERRRPQPESIFLAAMFHDIGQSLALRSLSSLIIAGKLPGIPDDATIDALLRDVSVEVGVNAQTVWNLPATLIEICRHQYAETVPVGAEWVETHIVRLVSNLNQLRIGTLDVRRPIDVLLDSARALRIGRSDLLTIALRLSDFAAQTTVLFSTRDTADECGYTDFVARFTEGKLD